MTLPIELEQEDDGRWFGIVEELPGVMAYGATREEAATATRALALRVLADRIEHGDKLRIQIQGIRLNECEGIVRLRPDVYTYDLETGFTISHCGPTGATEQV